ncbi:hypothetical protein ABN584_27635 [Gloeocapsa sp. BRSZ]
MNAQLCQEAAGEFRVDNRVDSRQESIRHEHRFTPVWRSNCTLIDWCPCGQERECDVSVLKKFLQNCQDGLVVVNSITNQPLPQIVDVDTNDILVAFTSNIDYMSEAQLEAAVRAISLARPDLIRRVLRVEKRSQ